MPGLLLRTLHEHLSALLAPCIAPYSCKKISLVLSPSFYFFVSLSPSSSSIFSNYYKMSMGGSTVPMTAAPGAAPSVGAPPTTAAMQPPPMFAPGAPPGATALPPSVQPPPAAAVLQPPPMFTPAAPTPLAAPGGIVAPPPLVATQQLPQQSGGGALPSAAAPFNPAAAAAPAAPASTTSSVGGYSSQVIELPTTSAGVAVPSPPAVYNWFFQHQSQQWSAFSKIDNDAIEAAPAPTGAAVGEDHPPVVTDGGRYEVDVADRTRTAVYWSAPANEIRRCLWLAGGGDVSKN